MELNEFIQRLMDNIQYFRSKWIEENQKSPSNFPMKLQSYQDWWEQFEMMDFDQNSIYDANELFEYTNLTDTAGNP